MSVISLARLALLTAQLVRAPAERVSAADIEEALALALSRYAADRPLVTCEDVIAAGGLDLPLPLTWHAESDLHGIEYPIGHFPQAMLRADSFALVPTPAGPVIRMASALNAGEPVRVFFTAPHQLGSSASTIPERHAEAFACWAAGVLCDQIAGTFASNSAPTIGADTADTSNPAREWRARASGFRARYAAMLGVQGVTGAAADKPQAKPAGAVAEFDLDDSRKRGWLSRYRT